MHITTNTTRVTHRDRHRDIFKRHTDRDKAKERRERTRTETIMSVVMLYFPSVKIAGTTEEIEQNENGAVLFSTRHPKIQWTRLLRTPTPPHQHHGHHHQRLRTPPRAQAHQEDE